MGTEVRREASLECWNRGEGETMDWSVEVAT